MGVLRSRKRRLSTRKFSVQFTNEEDTGGLLQGIRLWSAARVKPFLKSAQDDSRLVLEDTLEEVLRCLAENWVTFCIGEIC